MFKRIRLWLMSVWRWYRHRYLYVIADPTDNSITLSKLLFEHMDVMSHDVAKVFVFRVSDVYAFTLNPKLEQTTQLCDIQYNSKHHSIGFETLCPTVNIIFNDYRLPHDRKAKLSVEVFVSKLGMTYYTILRP